jgi:hypothetical protein
MPVKTDFMDTPEAEAGQDAALGLRVELVDSEPAIWRLFELRSSLPCIRRTRSCRQPLTDWEDAHLHRFTTGDPFAPLRPVDGQFPEVLQWIPGRTVKNRATGLRSIAPWISCSRLAQAKRFTNTTLETTGFTGSS